MPNLSSEMDPHLLMLINTILGGCILLLRWCALAPWRKLVRQVDSATREIGGKPVYSLLPATLGGICSEIGRLSVIARDSYSRRLEMARELEEAKRAMTDYRQVQQTIVTHASRGIHGQYQTVLTYAHYLEEQIAQKCSAPELRYDFDDVCESSFNLRLIAGALDLLQSGTPPVLASTSLSALMQQMMLALVPSLERRSMKLSTAAMDMKVCAATDGATLSYVLWMILLGTIRYAEAESTPRIRNLYDRQHKRALVSIVVSELAPGKLSASERGHYLTRQLQRLSPHMFAETIGIHANIQLAGMLLKTLDGAISIVTLNSHACEICLTLPAAESF